MDFFAIGLAPGLAIAALAAAFLALAWSAWRAPWARLADPFRLHGFLGASLALALAWRLAAEAAPGLAIHLLGTAAAALMFGPRLATLAAAIAVVVLTAWKGGVWANAGLNLLLLGALPAWAMEGFRRAVERWLPPNLFVYLIVIAFFGPGLVFAATVLAATAVQLAAGAFAPATVLDHFLPYGLLLAWGEAFLSGMLIAIFVVYVPSWVASFDDRRWIPRRGPGA